jgi:glycogen phosphorylase
MRKEIRRKKSLSTIHAEVNIGEKSYRTQFVGLREQLETKSDKLWSLMDSYQPRDPLTIQKSIMSHVEYTLARTRFNLDDQSLYKGTSLSVRDRLLENWNDSTMNIKCTNPKMLYYLSIEFLLGRLLQNALINLDLEEKYRDALNELGFKLEEIYEEEYDPALGNGGLGRLAACYLDSLTTMNYPGFGYGIRYDYGIFRQAIENFQQKEYPDYWLLKGNPWEIQRLDVQYKVPFYGYVKVNNSDGKITRSWEGCQEVIAIAYDTVIPGWNTTNCNTLRLWKSFAGEEFDFEAFNRGDYDESSSMKEDAGYITSVLYPNDSTSKGKELRLKQQYFFVCATIQDVIRRFLRTEEPWTEFPNKVAIQLNDTHPAIAIPELLRQLVDIYYVDIDEAISIVIRTFAYTNHTVLPEALEKWSVELFEKLLPRHLELIYFLNHIFLEKAKKDGVSNEIISKFSVIEECTPKFVRMANMSIIYSHKVNGVAAVHSMLLQTQLFKDFNDYFPNKFTNVTNGVTPRRWIVAAFPELSSLLTEYSGEEKDWLSDMTLLKDMPSVLKKNHQIEEFLEKFSAGKLEAKKRFAHVVKQRTGIEIDEHFMFDVQVKRIHEYKRQLLNIFHWVYRYMKIKSMSHEDRQKVVKRVFIMGGKAAPGYHIAKSIIRLANVIAQTINNDPEVSPYLKAVFIPNYTVSLAQVIIPAADLSQHISTAGTEASGTSNMKFAMTGSLIIGTRDGANIEIAEEIGEENIFFFGKKVNEVDEIRRDFGKYFSCPKLLSDIIYYIASGHFGNIEFIKNYLLGIPHGSDYYLITSDFDDYIKAQEQIDKEYSNLNEWYKKALISISRMGFFSSDRSIEDYANKIWNLKKVEPMRPINDQNNRKISRVNLKEV